MTVDIRAAAEAEAAQRYPPIGVDLPAINKSRRLRQKAFAAGAVWAQAQLTPTREQIAMALCSIRFPEEACRGELDCEESIGSHALEIAEALLALSEATNLTTESQPLQDAAR
ncbi:hypothetical protein [Leucobacter sp. 1207-22]|uniref:hypothetical protein n=1 Tax=Leucobacter sp. 1207-22 TaxID=2604456 RepID=UPI00406437FB